MADDINSKDINESTNIYDMVQDYASAIASVGDAKQNTSLYEHDSKCRKCGAADYKVCACKRFKDKGAAAGKPNGAQQQGKLRWKCKHCGSKDHKHSECPKKPKVAAAAEQPDKDKPKAGMSPDDILGVLRKISAGHVVLLLPAPRTSQIHALHLPKL